MEEGLFELHMDFDVGGDPARVYRALSEVIEAFDTLDGELLYVIGCEHVSTMELESIKIGSLKTVIRNILRDLPDDDIRNLDLKRLVGHFLVKAKYKFLRWCEETGSDISIPKLEVLSGEIVNLANDIDIKGTALKPNKAKLLTAANQLGEALGHLEAKDRLFYLCESSRVEVQVNFEADSDYIIELLTARTEKRSSHGSFLVKKPDYLGRSKWDLKSGGRVISVSIKDLVWLAKFHEQDVNVKPGDSIHGELTQITHYDESGCVILERFELDKISEHYSPRSLQQVELAIDEST